MFESQCYARSKKKKNHYSFFTYSIFKNIIICTFFIFFLYLFLDTIKILVESYILRKIFAYIINKFDERTNNKCKIFSSNLSIR